VREQNFFYLLFALLFLLLAVPVISDWSGLAPPLIRGLAIGAVLVLGVWTLRGSRRGFWPGALLASAGLLVSITAAVRETPASGIASIVIFMMFLVLAMASVLRSVLVGTEITANRLAGAVCIYLLLGVVWAMGYKLVQLLSPAAFRGLDGQDPVPIAFWIYYSFVTLTTLGYGDVVPASATARALAYTEVIVGQLYLVILVAGLVGAYISRRQDRSRPRSPTPPAPGT